MTCAEPCSCDESKRLLHANDALGSENAKLRQRVAELELLERTRLMTARRAFQEKQASWQNLDEPAFMAGFAAALGR